MPFPALGVSEMSPSFKMLRSILCHRFLAPAIGALGISPLNAAETEWPQFRGPTGQGVSAAVKVPTGWNATTHIAWKVAIPGSGWSSPVLSNGRLYLTTATGQPDGTDVKLHALCIDAASGAHALGYGGLPARTRHRAGNAPEKFPGEQHADRRR